MTEITRKGFVNKNGEKVQLIPAPHTHQKIRIGIDEYHYAEVAAAIYNDPVTGDPVSCQLEFKVRNGQSSIPAGAVLSEIGVSNLNRLAGTIDSVPTENSDTFITSGVVYTALQAIYSALEGKAPFNSLCSNGFQYNSQFSKIKCGSNGSKGKIDFSLYDSSTGYGGDVSLTYDNKNYLIFLLDGPQEPTSGSSRYITSGQVYTALQDKANTTDLQAKADKLPEIIITKSTLNDSVVLNLYYSQTVSDLLTSMSVTDCSMVKIQISIAGSFKGYTVGSIYYKETEANKAYFYINVASGNAYYFSLDLEDGEIDEPTIGSTVEITKSTGYSDIL